jgi:hypothetical protein
MQTSFGPGPSSGLASVVIVVRMTVTPLPIRTLFFHLQFHKGVILSVPFAEVYAEGTVFVVIPIVIVLVLTVIESVVVVTAVFFLTPVVLRLGPGIHCRRRCQCCAKNKKAEQILITTLHVIFLPAQDFLLGILGLQGVCGVRPGSDVRFRTPSMTSRVHTRKKQTLPLNGVIAITCSDRLG